MVITIARTPDLVLRHDRRRHEHLAHLCELVREGHVLEVGHALVGVHGSHYYPWVRRTLEEEEVPTVVGVVEHLVWGQEIDGARMQRILTVI